MSTLLLPEAIEWIHRYTKVSIYSIGKASITEKCVITSSDRHPIMNSRRSESCAWIYHEAKLITGHIQQYMCFINSVNAFINFVCFVYVQWTNICIPIFIWVFLLHITCIYTLAICLVCTTRHVPNVRLDLLLILYSMYCMCVYFFIHVRSSPFYLPFTFT